MVVVGGEVLTSTGIFVLDGCTVGFLVSADCETGVGLDKGFRVTIEPFTSLVVGTEVSIGGSTGPETGAAVIGKATGLLVVCDNIDGPVWVGFVVEGTWTGFAVIGDAMGVPVVGDDVETSIILSFGLIDGSSWVGLAVADAWAGPALAIGPPGLTTPPNGGNEMPMGATPGIEIVGRPGISMLVGATPGMPIGAMPNGGDANGGLATGVPLTVAQLP